jgi:hypothetical protein
LSFSTGFEASYAASIHHQVDLGQLGGVTDSELTIDATGRLEPLVGGAEDVLVHFDFATVFEDDGEVGVVWVVVYAAVCQC